MNKWNVGRSNRLVAEREQIKEHYMHMERLKNIKPCVDMKKPPKPTHIVNNYKKELKKMERMSEIQYQNRVLLRKMLQIDLKPNAGRSGNASAVLKRNNSAAHPGINSYNSLNRANRIRSLAKIIDENKVLLDKLQNTRSNYNNSKWENDFQEKQKLKHMITKNGDRFCRNPYFLNSICTNNA